MLNHFNYLNHRGKRQQGNAGSCVYIQIEVLVSFGVLYFRRDLAAQYEHRGLGLSLCCLIGSIRIESP